ncbi:hypothetical protein SAMN02910358_00021 [Lachnospiraceae bacterium XBB1006]|nr:hypothetical protein SAMN02910358_00021 [Lachnospiraceae bacterium XBB1006]
MNVYLHLKTINHHKWLVMTHCFRLGLIRQGLLHDLSKYNPVELFPGCKYYTPGKSPHFKARQELGLSEAWLHHKGRNKHHFEYWIDYEQKSKGLAGMKMPLRYVVEMFVDRMCACKNYYGEAYTCRSPWEYYERNKKYYLMHPDTQALLEELLLMLRDEGEEKTFRYIRTRVLKGKRKY